jgi:glycosyltransferase involved in cell wall biosynthesis
MGTMKKRYAFVLPRFGAGIVGGAETLAGSLATKLAHRGDHVEVFTTCAKDNRTWENVFPAGVSIEGGVIVRRFPVDTRDLEKWVPLQIRISEGLRLSVEEQLSWMRESVNSEELYDHIYRHGLTFDAIFFAPYLFGTTFWGALIHPSRSVLIPCLHDEYFAYLEIMSVLFREVRGALFNALPERELAVRLYGAARGGEVGMGFEPHPTDEVLEPYLDWCAPYILYVGRKETGKNVQLLIDYFISFKDRHPKLSDLRLVVLGGGSFTDLHRPHALERDDIIDLDHVSERDKQRLIQHSLCVCQPSVNESFSIVLMEAWLLSVPVLVHAGCDVTRHHAIQSGGGLYFGSQSDFDGVVHELVRNAGLAAQLGVAGRQYVKEQYSWERVLSRFDSVLHALP